MSRLTVAKTGELMFDNYPNGNKILDVEDSNPYQFVGVSQKHYVKKKIPLEASESRGI